MDRALALDISDHLRFIPMVRRSAPRASGDVPDRRRLAADRADPFPTTDFPAGSHHSGNQRPTLLPLEPRAEIPTRADASSIAYRRWLKEKGITYGTNVRAA
jgi:hypothetical protein